MRVKKWDLGRKSARYLFGTFGSFCFGLPSFGAETAHIQAKKGLERAAFQMSIPFFIVKD